MNVPVPSWKAPPPPPEPEPEVVAVPPPQPKPEPKPKPKPKPEPKAEPKPKPKPAPTRYHTVTPKQTLWAISQKYGISVAALQRANGLSGTLIRPGQSLRIP